MALEPFAMVPSLLCYLEVVTDSWGKGEMVGTHNTAKTTLEGTSRERRNRDQSNSSQGSGLPGILSFLAQTGLKECVEHRERHWASARP